MPARRFAARCTSLRPAPSSSPTSPLRSPKDDINVHANERDSMIDPVAVSGTPASAQQDLRALHPHARNQAHRARMPLRK